MSVGLGELFITISVIIRDFALLIATVTMLSPEMKIEAPHPSGRGCPLSPLLFALAMEPLAIHIPCSHLIKGLPICTIDTLVYLADFNDYLKSLLSEINTFGNYSGFRVDWNKSYLFPLDQVAIPMILYTTNCKYLGVTVQLPFYYINNLCLLLIQL